MSNIFRVCGLQYKPLLWLRMHIWDNRNPITIIIHLFSGRWKLMCMVTCIYTVFFRGVCTMYIELKKIIALTSPDAGKTFSFLGLLFDLFIFLFLNFISYWIWLNHKKHKYYLCDQKHLTNCSLYVPYLHFKSNIRQMKGLLLQWPQCSRANSAAHYSGHM